MQLCMIRLKVGVFEVLQGEATMMYCCSNSKCVCVCVCVCVYRKMKGIVWKYISLTCVVSGFTGAGHNLAQ